MSLTLAWALFVAAVPTPPAPVSPPPLLFALVVGNNRAEDPTTADLHFADDDALALHLLLREAGAHSVLLARPDADTQALHPHEVPTAPPSLTALLSAWEELRTQLAAATAAGRPAEFLFFFSGHGDVSHGEGFLALEGGRLTRTTLQQVLLASPARRNHVIIDACKSYFAVLSKGPGGTRAPYRAPFADGSALPPRAGFLLSTSSDGDSHEWDRYQAGIFSFEVRSGLRGSADANDDGQVTYGELGAFLTRANAGIANARFRPDFLVVPPGGATTGLDEVVLSWPVGSASLVLDGHPGHVYVESAAGERVLDANPAEPQAFSLHLPVERPLFVRDADEQAERLVATSQPTHLSTLPVSGPSVSRKGALHLAFAHLFSQPFGADAVQTFAVDYALREHPPTTQGAGSKTVRAAAPFVAGGALLLGLLASGLALEREGITSQTSQQERVARNQVIGAANVTIGISSVVAAVAVGAWAVLSAGDSAGEQSAQP